MNLSCCACSNKKTSKYVEAKGLCENNCSLCSECYKISLNSVCPNCKLKTVSKREESAITKLSTEDETITD